MYGVGVISVLFALFLRINKHKYTGLYQNLNNLKNKHYKNTQVIQTEDKTPEEEADDLLSLMSDEEKALALKEYLEANIKDEKKKGGKK